MKRSTLRRLTTLFIALLCLGVCAVLSGAVKRAATKASARALFCAYGGIGLRPVPTPPGFESEFAVAVVEINSPSKTMNVSVTDFVLLDRDDKATKLKRVVKVEVFDEPPATTEGTFAYYLNSVRNSGTRPWNGTLPAGRIQLRVRVALVEAPNDPVRFRLTVGRYTIEGPVNGSWPT
jgi:hypothetical protein